MSTKRTDEESIRKMLAMREKGMSNKQIAESLKINYRTVHRHIGRQPTELRVCKDKPDISKADKHNRKPVSTIVLIDKIERYSGEYGSYAINARSVTIDRTPKVTFGKKDLEKYITELIDVMGHISE